MHKKGYSIEQISEVVDLNEAEVKDIVNRDL
jgi:hypothetical protein